MGSSSGSMYPNRWFPRSVRACIPAAVPLAVPLQGREPRNPAMGRVPELRGTTATSTMPDPALPPPCPLCTSDESARACRDFVPPGICRQPERLVCDIVRSPQLTLEVLRSEERLRGLALALDRQARFA